MKKKYKKGKFKKDNTMVVLDIETTGFLGQGGLIVEVGMVSLNIKTGKIDTLFDSVCKEPDFSERHTQNPFGWIFKNSDLTFEEVMDALGIEKILPEVQKIINKHPLGCTAFNRSFDVKFLEDRGIEFGKLLPCPMKVSTPLCQAKGRYGQVKFPKVEEAWNHFFPDVPYVEAHRGADDSIHEAQIIYELIQQGHYWENK